MALKSFNAKELCLVSCGEKWHIRKGKITYCGLYDQLVDIGAGVLAAREDYPGICKRCLKQYHKNLG